MIVGECPGCKGPVLALKKENCPFCNEPTSHVSIRNDHIPRGGGLAPRCQGVIGQADSLDIHLDKREWKEAEEKATDWKERWEKENAPKVAESA